MATRISTADAARLYGVSGETIRRWVKAGHLVGGRDNHGAFWVEPAAATEATEPPESVATPPEHMEATVANVEATVATQGMVPASVVLALLEAADRRHDQHLAAERAHHAAEIAALRRQHAQEITAMLDRVARVLVANRRRAPWWCRWLVG